MNENGGMAKNEYAATTARASAEERWSTLERACAQCEKCALCRTRNKVVVGKGNKNAKLMFVGEAPGREEDESGEPFVGRAGKLLDRFLYAVDIPPDDIYVANVLKCRPPNNRDPLPEEEDICIEYLREQVRLVRPSIIVCLGRIAAQRLIGSDVRITRDHGKWLRRGNFWMTALYHPAALLRDPPKKEQMLEDMKSVKKKFDALS